MVFPEYHSLDHICTISPHPFVLVKCLHNALWEPRTLMGHWYNLLSLSLSLCLLLEAVGSHVVIVLHASFRVEYLPPLLV